jgi:hypothetical protein
MQPYFFPYIGYFQLIGAVDLFIVYDNIKYTKKGWINRNRILLDGNDAVFSLPLKKGSDALTVRERELASSFDCSRLLDQIRGAYGGAPHIKATLPMLERILCYEDRNLFQYLHHSIAAMCEYLGIQTAIRVSSTVNVDHGLKGEDKVLSLCKALGASCYINPIGGVALYSNERFTAYGIDLKFIRSRPFVYEQFGKKFVPSLSIVDVLMFNTLEVVRDRVSTNYELLNRVHVEETG